MLLEHKEMWYITNFAPGINAMYPIAPGQWIGTDLRYYSWSNEYFYFTLLKPSVFN